jgi:hypothetical protein
MVHTVPAKEFDVTAKDKRGFTALMVAKVSRYKEIVRVLE